MELVDRELALSLLEKDGYPKVTKAYFIIKNLPAVEVAPVAHGKWEVIGMRPVKTRYTHYCSVCGGHGNLDMQYCPNCGAKME